MICIFIIKFDNGDVKSDGCNYWWLVSEYYLYIRSYSFHISQNNQISHFSDSNCVAIVSDLHQELNDMLTLSMIQMMVFYDSHPNLCYVLLVWLDHCLHLLTTVRRNRRKRLVYLLVHRFPKVVFTEFVGIYQKIRVFIEKLTIHLFE